MNGILAQYNGSTKNKSNNKGNWGKVNKFGSIIYRCFIYNFVEHKIYDYPLKYAIQKMFKEKITTMETKKEDVVNMVMVITTCSQLSKNVVFKEKEPRKNKNLVD